MIGTLEKLLQPLQPLQGDALNEGRDQRTPAIAAWKANAEHRVAQVAGRRKWYQHFEVRIARVERAYGGP